MSIAFFFALYCIEAGLFFVVVPWTHLWTMNPLLQGEPLLALAANPFLRGFVSGFGVIHIIIGINDMLRLSQARRAVRE